MIRSGYSKSYINEDDADSWITVRGQHIPLDGEGNPVGGNPKVFGKNEHNKKPKKEDDPENNKSGRPAENDEPEESRDTEKFSPKRVRKDDDGDHKSFLDGLGDLADTAKEMLGHEDGVADLVGEITNK